MAEAMSERLMQQISHWYQKKWEQARPLKDYIFSTVTFDGMMYVTERMLETNTPVIIEGNFVPAGVKKIDEAGAIKHLVAKYNYTSLDFKFIGNTQVLHQRFLQREKTAKRGEVNKIGTDVSYDTFRQWCHNFDDFDIGGCFT